MLNDLGMSIDSLAIPLKDHVLLLTSRKLILNHNSVHSKLLRSASWDVVNFDFRYLYADLYGSGGIWVGKENPENSGNFTSAQVPYSCAKDTPIQCDAKDESSPVLGAIFSFGQDNSKDTFMLTSSGLYRIVSPSRCNYTCSKETVIPHSPPASTPPPPSPSTSMATPWRHQGPEFLLLSLILSYMLLFGFCCDL